MSVESVVKVRDNGSLIAEVAKLWIGPEDVVLDTTYGKGKWWTRHRPLLITNDIDPNADVDYHYDFRQFPAVFGGIYDVAAFDPPYIAKGGRDTSSIDGMDAAYGLHDAPRTPEEMAEYHDDGIWECARVLKPRGRLLVKTMDYISSGKYQSGYANTHWQAQGAGLELADVFVHHSDTGPQPKFNRDGTLRRQVHSRRSHSYLMVFLKGK